MIPMANDTTHFNTTVTQTSYLTFMKYNAFIQGGWQATQFVHYIINHLETLCNLMVVKTILILFLSTK